MSLSHRCRAFFNMCYYSHDDTSTQYIKSKFLWCRIFAWFFLDWKAKTTRKVHFNKTPLSRQERRRERHFEWWWLPLLMHFWVILKNFNVKYVHMCVPCIFNIRFFFVCVKFTSLHSHCKWPEFQLLYCIDWCMYSKTQNWLKYFTARAARSKKIIWRWKNCVLNI